MDMMSTWVHLRGRAVRFAVPVVAVAAAAGVSWIVRRETTIAAAPLFIVAVAVSTWVGGLRPGLLAMALAVAAMTGLVLIGKPEDGFGVSHLLWGACLAIVVLLVGSVDIARRRSAQMLNERDTRLRLVSEQIPAGLWSTDDQLRLSSRFGGAPTLFKGRLGMSMTEFFPGASDDFPPIAAHLRALRGEPSTFELPWQGKVFQAHVEPLQNVEGHIIGVIGVALDISERQRDEQRLVEAKADAERAQAQAERAQAEAERATQARDQFLAMLSHELRTPLTPALMATAELEHRTELPADVRQDLEMIGRNIRLESRLIDDLLDLTRVASGKLKLDLRRVDAHAVLRDAVEVCRADLPGRQIELALDLAASRHEIHGDPARLQQVFWNLIKNALKFTPPGGRIDVRTFNGADPDELVVEVSDTGIGIDPALLPRLFNAFEQGGTSTTNRFGGLGLGLAISRALVEALDGNITASSEGVGRGATFRVTLRASAFAQTSGPATPGKGPVGSATPLQILLVEDHADTRHVLERLLRGAGHFVFTADTADTALRTIEDAEGEQIELLISDLALPDGTGMDVVRGLRKHRPHAHVKAIALSGWGMADDVRRSTEAGFDRHLTKPVSFDALLDAIEQLRVTQPSP